MKFVSYMTPGFPVRLFELIAEAIGAELTLVATSSGPLPGADPFAAGEFDIGWMCSISYTNLQQEPVPSIDVAGVAWVPDDPDVEDEPIYFADIVVPADSSIINFADLRGVRLGCNDEVSLSGLYALRFELERLGLGHAESFCDLVFTGGHQASLDQVLAGQVQAATVDSVVRLGRAKRDPAVAALRVVGRLGPWPVPPLVVRADLPKSERTRIVHALIAASRRAEFQAELQAAGLRSLVTVDAAHYESVSKAMRSIAEGH